MPLSSIKLMPGVNLEVTEVLGQAQITSSQLIRFRAAGNDILPEKLGGWQKFYPLALGSVVRDLDAWEGINADSHLAAGCEASLQVITNGVAQNITPRTATTNPAVSFTTTMSSTTVQIDDAGFTASIYDSIYLLTPVSIGGIVLQGAYQVQTVIDADSYTITAASAASSAVATGGAVPSFGVISGSSQVTVTLANHPYAVGEVFSCPTPTTVGGITISGAYLVQTVPSSSTFTINASSAASSTTSGSMNGGNASIEYFVGLGPPAAAAGYGTSTYGSGPYGIGTVPTGSTGSPITATNWTLDNWGEVLLACPANGPVYQWSPDGGFSAATKVVNAPLINGGIFVSQPAQILVAYASSQGGVQDPLSINWSDAGDYTNWTPSSQTQAGGYRLPTGSRIVGGISGPNFGVIWTDVDVWAMNYIEVPLIFGFDSLGSNCGLISRHGMAVLNSTVYWMGNEQFFLLNGETVQTIPCPVWDFVFQDLDTAHTDKIFVGTNSLFNEVVFYFPSQSGGTGDVDSYVKFNPMLNTWDFGRLARTAWVDQSPVGKPVGAAPTGFLYQHETSPDADGQPLVSSFTTGFFRVNDGENLDFIDWLFPDFKWGYYSGTQSASLQITLNYKDYPNAAVKSRGPYTVNASTPYVNTRLRGRYTQMNVLSQDLGSFWRLGNMQLRSAPDGKR